MRIQYESELYHHGIKGQKWGVRKYQNADGSYTAAGRKRYAKQLSKDFNKAAKREAQLSWLAGQNAARVSRGRKIASATNKGIFKPISKLSTVYANRAEKAFNKQTQASQQQVRLANAALDAAKKSGFTAQTYTKLTYAGESGGYSVYVRALQAKFTDPTQPKNRAERREEKDRNRLKNAAYEMDQAKADWKAKNAKAEATVGTTKEKTKYGTMERWNDPEHQHVKDVRAAQGRSFDADKRFAKEFDAYKNKHPNTDMDLSDWEKKRKKMYY